MLTAQGQLEEIQRVKIMLEDLGKIARSLQRLHEANCNYGLSERQQMREDKLVAQAKQIVEDTWLNLTIYEQGDPRGCPLYIVPKGKDNAADYYNGVGISGL